MNNKEFKVLFGSIAKANGFERAFSGWFKESPECIIVLDLQKSNFGDYYELNIKVFVQGMLGNIYVKNKNLVKKDMGDVFTRQPNNYSDVFDFDIIMDDINRRERLENLFNDYLAPFTNKALSKSGLKDLAEKNEIFLLPAIKAGLGL
ncbi:MAG: DUF4304 domain-containing protein [Mucilaginibacter sp.]